MRNNFDPDALSQALAEPSRRALLENLRYGSKSVSELVNATELKQPNVSNHLAKMRQQGIVRAERKGRQVYYALSAPFADVLLRMHEVAGNSDARDIAALHAHANGHTEPADETAHATSALENDWQQTFSDAVMHGDEDQAVALVNAMLARHWDMAAIYTNVFQICLNRIGEMYQQGLTDEAHEHMASAIIERMMARVSQFYTPIARTSRRAVFACVAGNWHVIGLRMLADGLRAVGWETIFLGANVPCSSLVSIVSSLHPDLVVLACAMEDQEPSLLETVAQLDALRHTASADAFCLVAGGHWLQHRPELLHTLPIDFTAHSLPDFIAVVAERFDPSSPPSNAAPVASTP